MINKKDEKTEKRLAFYKKQIDSDEYNDRKETKIIWDGRQYSVRIPKKFAGLVGVKKGDIFVFEIKIPPHDSKEKPQLVGTWFTKEKE